MSQPPGATRSISPIFLGKQSPGKEIGLAGIRYSIFCRVLRQAIPALFNQLHGASSQNAEYVYFDLMQEEYAQNQKYFTGEQRRDTRDFPPLSGTRGARCREAPEEKKRRRGASSRLAATAEWCLPPCVSPGAVHAVPAPTLSAVPASSPPTLACGCPF
jgi:hypothetical protein